MSRLSDRLREIHEPRLSRGEPTSAWEAADMLDQCLRDFDLIDYELTQGDVGRASWIAKTAAKRLRGEQ